MPFPKTIQLFLMDGEPTGRIACEMHNWTGKAYKIPRIRLKECKARAELNNPGLYILFGSTEAGEPAAYIGEAEDVLYRLNQHLGSKEFWNEVIVFVSKDDYLNKAHIKYLENHLHNIGIRLNRYVLYNGNVPNRPTLSESDQAVMDEFIYHIRLLTTTLGHKIFEEKRAEQLAPHQPTSVQPEKTPLVEETIFHLSSNRGAEARGKPTAEGFVVLKGSKFVMDTSKSFAHYYLKTRKKLIEEKKLIPENRSLVLVEDHVLPSPSNAASLILGRSANGLTEWKLTDGTTLKAYEEGEQ